MSALGPFLQALLGRPPAEAVLYAARREPPAETGGKPLWAQVALRSPEDARAWLEGNAGLGDTYVALAAFRPGRGRTAGAVLSRSWLSVDIDDKAMPGQTPEERHGHASTLARSLPCPTVIVDSGNGYHVHVRLPERDRVEAYADPADGVRHVQLLGRALRIYLEDRAQELLGSPVTLDHCHGAERVWRVPGGLNIKAGPDSKAVSKDPAQWRPVSLVSPGRPEGLAHVAPANLSFLIPFIRAAEDEESARAPSSHPPWATLDSPEGQKWPSDASSVAVAAVGGGHFDPQRLPDRLRSKWPMREGDQSENDFALASFLAQAGWSPATARAAITLRRSLLADSSDRAKGGREDYVARTVGAAYEQVLCAPLPEGARPYVPFPLAALPPTLQRFVAAGSRVLGCAMEAIVLPLLAVLGAAIGNTRRLALKRTWREPPLLWTAVILPSGAKKSPSLDLVLAPVRRAQTKALRRYAEEMKEWEEDVARYQAELADWKKAGEDRDPSPPERPERPVAERFLVSDTTLEGLLPILQENDRGVLLFRDELAAFLKSFDAYRQGRGGDREQWLSIHRAGAALVDRKQNRAILYVPNAFVAICGGIQPRTLRRVLTEEFFECGLPARLLMAAPPTVRSQWTDEELPAHLEAQVERVHSRLLSLTMKRDEDDEFIPGAMGLSPEAKRLWVEFYNSFAGEQHAVEGEDDVSAAFSKIEGYAARLALIVCLVEWAGGPEKEPPSAVDAGSMERGIRLARWFAQEAVRVYAQFGEADADRERRLLIEWIRQRGGQVRTRDVQRGLRQHRADTRGAEAALSDLVSAHLGWWVALPPPAGGGVAGRAFRLRDELLACGDGDARSLQGPFHAASEGRVSPADPDAPETQTLLEGEEVCTICGVIGSDAHECPGGDGDTRFAEAPFDAGSGERVSPEGEDGPDGGDAGRGGPPDEPPPQESWIEEVA